MTAVEARALTDTHRGESPVDYLMRTQVWPGIQHACAVPMYETRFIVNRGDCWRMWESDGHDLLPGVVERLELAGFKVERRSLSSCEEVRVSW